MPIHPASSPTQERDLLRLLGEPAIEPHSRRRFHRGEVPLLNADSLFRLTLLTCDGRASSVRDVRFGPGSVVTIEGF